MHKDAAKHSVQRSDLDDFVACYNPKNRHERKESERFKSFTYEELTKRDKLNLDIFWLKDESLEDSANLPESDVIAAELIYEFPFAHPSGFPSMSSAHAISIVEDLQAALAQVEIRSLPTRSLLPSQLTLITRTASCSRQLP